MITFIEEEYLRFRESTLFAECNHSMRAMASNINNSTVRLKNNSEKNSEKNSKKNSENSENNSVNNSERNSKKNSEKNSVHNSELRVGLLLSSDDDTMLPQVASTAAADLHTSQYSSTYCSRDAGHHTQCSRYRHRHLSRFLIGIIIVLIMWATGGGPVSVDGEVIFHRRDHRDQGIYSSDRRVTYHVQSFGDAMVSLTTLWFNCRHLECYFQFWNLFNVDGWF